MINNRILSSARPAVMHVGRGALIVQYLLLTKSSTLHTPPDQSLSLVGGGGGVGTRLTNLPAPCCKNFIWKGLAVSLPLVIHAYMHTAMERFFPWLQRKFTQRGLSMKLPYGAYLLDLK